MSANIISLFSKVQCDREEAEFIIKFKQLVEENQKTVLRGIDLVDQELRHFFKEIDALSRSVSFMSPQEIMNKLEINAEEVDNE
jgi:hypothetical protein